MITKTIRAASNAYSMEVTPRHFCLGSVLVLIDTGKSLRGLEYGLAPHSANPSFRQQAVIKGSLPH